MSLADQSYVHDKDLIMQEHYTVYNGFLIALGPDLYDPILRLQKEVPWMLGNGCLCVCYCISLLLPLVWVNHTKYLLLVKFIVTRVLVNQTTGHFVREHNSINIWRMSVRGSSFCNICIVHSIHHLY